MDFRNKANLQIVLWGALLVVAMAPFMIAAQENGTEPEPNPNPTLRLITPRNDQSSVQQLVDERECFDWACEQTEWNPYEAYTELVDEGYAVALTPDDTEEWLIFMANEGAVTGSVAGYILGNENAGARIGAAIAIASGLVHADFLNQPDDPETRRTISGFERNLRYWDKKFAACLRPKGYRVPSSDN